MSLLCNRCDKGFGRMCLFCNSFDSGEVVCACYAIAMIVMR